MCIHIQCIHIHFNSKSPPVAQQVRSTNSWRESKSFYFDALFACFAHFVFLHFFYPYAFLRFLLFLCINIWCLGGAFVRFSWFTFLSFLHFLYLLPFCVFTLFCFLY